jgi:hypothetical protein
VTKVPIACSLSSTDAGNRVSEWNEFLKTHVTEVERTPWTARLRLRDDDVTLSTAIDLARREKVCCAFFEFRLAIHVDDLWLEIEIPNDAGVSMDDLSFLIAP